jgi:putative acyl-CoA dehydrogenase
MRASRPLFRATHEVFNQAKPLSNYNMFLSDPILSTTEFLPANQRKIVEEYGQTCGSLEKSQHATLAEKNKPTLRQFDNYGRRIDVIDFHDSYHHLMRQGLSHGVSGYGHRTEEKGSHITRAALLFMQNQLEPGHCCPLVMTTAAVMPLKKWGRDDLVKKLLVFDYDPRNVPIEEKRAITAGMSMTEKQGGSDVRANTTLATPIDSSKTGNGQAYSLMGHKVCFNASSISFASSGSPLPQCVTSS